jgi:hypothetical protein
VIKDRKHKERERGRERGMEGRYRRCSSTFDKVRTLFYRFLSCEVLVEDFVLVLLTAKNGKRDVRHSAHSMKYTYFKQAYTQTDRTTTHHTACVSTEENTV